MYSYVVKWCIIGKQSKCHMDIHRKGYRGIIKIKNTKEMIKFSKT